MDPEAFDCQGQKGNEARRGKGPLWRITEDEPVFFDGYFLLAMTENTNLLPKELGYLWASAYELFCLNASDLESGTQCDSLGL